VWLAEPNSEFSASIIDGFICAEIPDINIDPLGYALVDEFMIHGPCGDDNKKMSMHERQQMFKEFS